MWADMMPPSDPDSSFEASNVELQSIAGWKKLHAIAVLAGLLTEPKYYANGIRLDWLLRLVIAKSSGQKRPKPSEWSRVLNAGLETAKVLRLEDPVEDLFCDTIATRRGNFRIFTAQWEAAGPYTQTLLNAFVSLPSGRLKDGALESVYALLRLSDAIAERAGVYRFTESGGDPMGVLSVPGADVLSALAKRMRFTDEELARLGILKSALTPFFLPAENYPYVSDRSIGDTPLEFRPLIANPNSTIVASPANISLAVRYLIVHVALHGGLDRLLNHRLMIEQQKYSEFSGFWPSSLHMEGPNLHGMRACVAQYDHGRYLHIIQIPTTFDGFPANGFGSVRQLGKEANKFLAADVERFWKFCSDRGDFRHGTTVMLFSGWGVPHSFQPPIPDETPSGWHYLALSFADAAVLGACEDGKINDIIRILEQQERLERDGFSFMNPNGILNLFGFWRTTRGNLIPEHLTEIKPPANIVLPTDELLKPRSEAAKNRDFKALPLAKDDWRLVQRLDWNEPDDLKPIYASLDDVSSGRLLGVTSFDGRNWWLQTDAGTAQNRDWQYRVWHALMQWLGEVAPKIIAKLPDSFPVGSFKLELVPPASRDIDSTSAPTLAFAGIVVTPSNGGAKIELQADWMKRLRNPQNDAEVELVATMLHSICAGHDPSLSRTNLVSTVLEAVGSTDWRWLHARQVFTPIDGLESCGIVGPFREIGLSAFSLAKCQSIWEFRSRQDSLEIVGEEECCKFLIEYGLHLRDKLISQLREFDRTQLCLLAGSYYQRARAEQSRWRRTIRALRAIHGSVADVRAFERQNAINAMQRATKAICEMAACEAPLAGGRASGFSDLQELGALVLQLFGNSQLHASIRGGIDKPHLKISPGGDVLSDRTISESTLRPGAEWVNVKALNESAEAYIRERTEPAEERQRRSTATEELWDTLKDEYGVSDAGFANLQYVLVDIACKRGEADFVIRRSELAKLLMDTEQYKSEDPMPILKRLTLPHRSGWTSLSEGMLASDIDVSRFDRPFSVINRPLVALEGGDDPLMLCVPIFVSDALMYSLSGLMEGHLQGRFWVSESARSLAGANADVQGKEFEKMIANRLNRLGLQALPDIKLSWPLNEKVPDELGNIDVLAVSADKKRVWVIEAKNLKLCRTEVEVASRLSNYRGALDKRGKPDDLLKHLRRVKYLRERREKLVQRLGLAQAPEVKSLLVFDSPQPMNFYMLEQKDDCESTRLDTIESFQF
jgi:hypothetical protein